MSDSLVGQKQQLRAELIVVQWSRSWVERDVVGAAVMDGLERVLEDRGMYPDNVPKHVQSRSAG